MSKKVQQKYKIIKKIANSLQGCVYLACNDSNENVILKTAFIKLYNAKQGLHDNKLYNIKENIAKEAETLKYLLSVKPTMKGLIKYIDFWCDNDKYYLLMEYGGNSLFDHVKLMHKYIENNELKITEWKTHIKILFKQMCLFINWLHNKCRISHLDISLGNMSIKNCEFKNGKFISHGQIYFIDYGVSQYFNNKNEIENCTKYVGKKLYQSPKLYNKIPYNAFKSDIWSLGVVLFMMTFGKCPYNIPHINDKMFCNIIGGHLIRWLNDLNLLHYVDNALLNIFKCIFCSENNRITIEHLILML